LSVGGQQRRVHVQDQPSGIGEVRSAASDPHPSTSIGTGSPEQLELGSPDPVQHPARQVRQRALVGVDQRRRPALGQARLIGELPQQGGRHVALPCEA